MDYQEFINLWLEALGQARFPSLHLLRPSETIDIRSMDRTYKNYLWWPETPETKTFHVTAEISWVWDLPAFGSLCDHRRRYAYANLW